MVKITISPSKNARIWAFFLARALHWRTRGKEGPMTSLMWVMAGIAAVAVILLIPTLLGMRVIPNNMVGIVEKLWSTGGSLPEGRLIAMDGEAGFQAELLRGGVHFGYPLWQYRVHKVRLTA